VQKKRISTLLFVVHSFTETMCQLAAAAVGYWRQVLAEEILVELSHKHPSSGAYRAITCRLRDRDLSGGRTNLR